MAKDGTNRGRPEGSMNKLAREAREHAKATGDGRLPHEILLDMARGKPVQLVVVGQDGAPVMLDDQGTMQTRWEIPDLDQMKDAAKAAAPYYAPKISTVEVLAGATEDDLDRLIAVFAAQAGVSLTAGAQGEDGEEEDGGGDGAGDRTEAVPAGGGGGTTVLRRRAVTGTRS